MTPDATAAVNAIVAALQAGGVLVGAVILIWLLLTERLVPFGRLRDEREARIKAETQRDEALEISRAQVDATKETAAISRETLQYLRDELPRRPRTGR